MNTTMQNAMAAHIANGWTVQSVTDDTLVMAKKKSHGCGVVLVCILFFPIGLLALLIDPGTETKMITAESIEAELAALKAQEEAEAIRQAEIQRKRDEFKANHKFLGKFGTSARNVLIVMALLAFLALSSWICVYSMSLGG